MPHAVARGPGQGRVGTHAPAGAPPRPPFQPSCAPPRPPPPDCPASPWQRWRRTAAPRRARASPPLQHKAWRGPKGSGLSERGARRRFGRRHKGKRRAGTCAGGHLGSMQAWIHASLNSPLVLNPTAQQVVQGHAYPAAPTAPAPQHPPEVSASHSTSSSSCSSSSSSSAASSEAALPLESSSSRFLQRHSAAA